MPLSSEAPSAPSPAGGASASRIWKTTLFTALVVFSSVAGNAFLSWGMKHVPAEVTLGIPEFFHPFLSPFVWLGIALLIVWMLSRMTLLTWADLSFVVPVTSLGYVLNVAAGALVLGEVVDAKRWIGALLIVAGSILTGLTIGDQANVHRAEPRREGNAEGKV
jgi:drug/metabolite transporter (DMT)-like permease